MFLNMIDFTVLLEGTESLPQLEAGLREAYMIRFSDIPSADGSLPQKAVERLLRALDSGLQSAIIDVLTADGFIR